MINLTEVSNLYINLFSDCVPVKGAKRSSICDLTRGNIFLFQSEYFEVLKYILTDRIENILRNIDSVERDFVVKFINLLYENEFISFQEYPSIFPQLNEHWEWHSRIQNAIIDVKEKNHDYERIFDELDDLGCEFVQLRFFSNNISLLELKKIISFAKNKSIESVEVILKYDSSISDNEYISFIENEPIIVNFILHSSPLERIIKINFGLDESMKLVFRNINLVSRVIDSELHCGIISLKNLTPPSTATFLENKIRNGCLNGKVSIDCRGEIKNCPSMKYSYGNINETKLKTAVSNSIFQDYELINKDQIKVCKDCEFRFVCSDCRAYLEDPKDNYSKPLKCGFDPYSSEWKTWFDYSFKKSAIQHYNLTECHL
jgi:SPASM domain peptide maturase of grasp-with-spasm system